MSAPLLPRRLIAQQGSDAKIPAEDLRLALGGLITPGPGTALASLSGVLAGSGSSGYGCDVSSPSAAHLSVAAGNFVIQRTTTNGGAYLGVIDAPTALTITGLPTAGQFKAGYVLVHAYDEAYGDLQDGAALEVLLGASSSTASGAAYPTVPTNALVLAGFTVNSTGTVTFTSSAVRVVARGGIIPVVTGDTLAGDYVGQWRDEPQLGLQRWSGGDWYRPHPIYWGPGLSYPSAPQPGDTFLHTGLGVLMRYNGTAWRQAEDVLVNNAAARTAISAGFAALLYSGFRVRQTDVNHLFEWDAVNQRWSKVPSAPTAIYTSNGTGSPSIDNGFSGTLCAIGTVPAHSPGPLRVSAAVEVYSAVAGTFAGFLQLALGTTAATISLRERIHNFNVGTMFSILLEGYAYSDGTAKTLYLLGSSDTGSSVNWASPYQNTQVFQL